MFPDYMEAMTGIGVEDLYYGYPRDHEPSPPRMDSPARGHSGPVGSRRQTGPDH
jgi:hypothetical protein